jgi:thiamine biosynthesis lipoprotein
MGTLCEVQVYHADARAAGAAITRALDEMQRVDRLLSHYDPSSELSAMNRGAAAEPFRVSDELFGFVSRCREYFSETQGAFDPTVGPLVRAWGFIGSRPAKPSDEAIATARARSGFSKVTLDASERTVWYAAPGFELDPGGIGKGYAVDKAVEILRHADITSALVSAGGSTVFAIGHPPGRDAWRLGVSDPGNVERPLRYVRLRDAAVSTSGLAQRSVREATRRYSHIFDPRTGEPVEGMCQVTVVAGTATDSDALTKAATVLDRETVLRVFGARRERAHALRVEGDCAGGMAVWVTPWSGEIFAETAGEAAPLEPGAAASRH